MVDVNFVTPQMSGRWLKYLVLSACVNLLIVFVVMATAGSGRKAMVDMPMLKVNLMAVAATTPQGAERMPVPSSAPRKIIVEQRATDRISVHRPITELEVASEKRTPVPQKHGREHATKPVSSTPSQGSDKEMSTVIHQANYRRQIPPVYPPRALELGQEGLVTLHAEIMPSGLPGKLEVASSSGHRLLDRAAFTAVKKWEFEPMSVGGKAVTSWVRVPVRFVIRK